MLANFEELLLKCGEEARPHIREAITCYEMGAYRSSIVGAYVAVCLDLIEKLKVLSSAGDGRALEHLNHMSQLQGQLDNGNHQAISGLLDFERRLIEIFRNDFDFFGVIEFDDLERLRADRNRCAHPTFLKSELPYRPSAEQARLHLRNALNLVLTQEPRQGKAALAEVQAAILSKYFPEDVPGAVARLTGIGVRSARDSLVRAIVDDIIFGIPTSTHPYYNKVAPYSALDAVIEINRPLALPRAVIGVDKLLSRSEDIAIQVGSSIALRNRDIGDAVNQHSQGVISGWLEKADYIFIASAVKRGLSMPWLRKSAENRLKTLTADEIGKTTKDVPVEILNRAAELYCQVGNWDQANDVADKCAIPLADRFVESNVRVIFESAHTGAADLKGSHGFRKFIAALYNENPMGKDKFDELTKEYALETYRP